MPWPDRQRKAIAARMIREGKSPEEISKFFREHGHGGDKEKADDKKPKPKRGK